jgi:hypothetical protein
VQYKNPKIFDEMNVEDIKENDQLFNNLIVDFNRCYDYPEEFERYVIYQNNSFELFSLSSKVLFYLLENIFYSSVSLDLFILKK